MSQDLFTADDFEKGGWAKRVRHSYLKDVHRQTPKLGVQFENMAWNSPALAPISAPNRPVLLEQ